MYVKLSLIQIFELAGQSKQCLILVVSQFKAFKSYFLFSLGLLLRKEYAPNGEAYSFPFKVWLSQCGNRLYHWKVGFYWYRNQQTKYVCPFIAYCVSEFQTVFRVLICWQFLFIQMNSANYSYRNPVSTFMVILLSF